MAWPSRKTWRSRSTEQIGHRREQVTRREIGHGRGKREEGGTRGTEVGKIEKSEANKERERTKAKIRQVRKKEEEEKVARGNGGAGEISYDWKIAQRSSHEIENKMRRAITAKEAGERRGVG